MPFSFQKLDKLFSKDRVFKYLGNPFAVSVFYVAIIMIIAYVHFKDTESPSKKYVSMTIYVGIASFIIMWINYYINREITKRDMSKDISNSTFCGITNAETDLKNPIHQDLMQRQWGESEPPSINHNKHDYGGRPLSQAHEARFNPGQTQDKAHGNGTHGTHGTHDTHGGGGGGGSYNGHRPSGGHRSSFSEPPSEHRRGPPSTHGSTMSYATTSNIDNFKLKLPNTGRGDN